MEIATSIEEAVAYRVVDLVYFVCVILIGVFHKVLVGADPVVLQFPPITIDAKSLIAVGKIVIYQPVIETSTSGHAKLFTMLSTIVMNMVYLEKCSASFPTTSALPTIVVKYPSFDLRIILLLESSHTSIIGRKTYFGPVTSGLGIGLFRIIPCPLVTETIDTFLTPRVLVLLLVRTKVTERQVSLADTTEQHCFHNWLVSKHPKIPLNLYRK